MVSAFYIKLLTFFVVLGFIALGWVIICLIKCASEEEQHGKELDDKIKCLSGAVVATKGLSADLQAVKEAFTTFRETTERALEILRGDVERLKPFAETTNINNANIVTIEDAISTIEQRLGVIEDTETTIEIKSDLLKTQNRVSIIENTVRQIDEDLKTLADCVNENAAGVLKLLDAIKSAGAGDSTAENKGGDKGPEAGPHIDAAPAPESGSKKEPKTAKKSPKTAPKIPVTTPKTQKTPKKAPTSVSKTGTDKKTGKSAGTPQKRSTAPKTAKTDKAPAVKSAKPKTAPKKSVMKTEKKEG